jgi:hypothetical protein
MEKALQYEYEDILSKTRKISSFKSRIVLYFHFICSYLIMICVLPTYANSFKPSNHIVKKIPLRKATSQPGFQLSPFVEKFFESIPGLLIIFILPTYANSLKPSNHIVKKIPLRKATSQPRFQLSPFIEMLFESIPGLLIIFIPWDLYPKNILM